MGLERVGLKTQHTSVFYYPLHAEHIWCLCTGSAPSVVVILISMILKYSATTSTLHGMLLGRLLVGAGMGLGPPVAALYVAEVSKTNCEI